MKYQLIEQPNRELRNCVKIEVNVLGSPVPNSPRGLCGRKATLKDRAQEVCESGGGRK